MRWRKREGRMLDQLQQEINAMIVNAVADAVVDYPGPDEQGYQEVLHLIREMQLWRHTDWQPAAKAVQNEIWSWAALDYGADAEE